MKQSGLAWVSLIAYGLVAVAIAGAVWAIYAGIKRHGYKEAEAHYKPKLEEMTRDRDDTRAKYDAFAADVERKGKEQAARAAALDAENAKREAERKADYEKRLALLHADRDRLAERVRKHFAGPGADRDRVSVPGDAESACAPGHGPADDVSALRRSLEGLAADCAVTTTMFLACRDAWRGVAR